MARTFPLQRLRSARYLELPGGWARNTVNTCIYRGAGLLTVGENQFGAYYESNQSILLFRRSLSAGSVELARLEVSAMVKDAHNCISLGCDSDGYLHLSYNQHGSRLCYVQSLRPYDVTAWCAPRPMSGVWEDSVTYPYFVTPRSEREPLLFFFRRGVAVAGDLHLKVFDRGNRRWRDVPSPVLAGAQLLPWTSGPYLNHPAVDRRGRLHLFFTWRTALCGSDQLVNNHNIDYACSTDNGLSWEASNGQPLPLPITPVSTETIFGTPPGANLMNQCGAAVDSTGRPFVTFYAGGHKGITLFLMWHDGHVWRTRQVRGAHEGFELKGKGTLNLPMSRPDLVLDRMDRAWLLYRHGGARNRLVAVRLDPPKYREDEAKTFLLWSRELGAAEPVVDRGRLAHDGVLSLFLQRTEQGDHETLAGPQSSPVFIADWHLGDQVVAPSKVDAR